MHGGCGASIVILHIVYIIYDRRWKSIRFWIGGAGIGPLRNLDCGFRSGVSEIARGEQRG